MKQGNIWKTLTAMTVILAMSAGGTVGIAETVLGTDGQEVVEGGSDRGWRCWAVPVKAAPRSGRFRNGGSGSGWFRNGGSAGRFRNGGSGSGRFRNGGSG